MENKKCDQCEKSFLFENTLRLHIENAHVQGSPILASQVTCTRKDSESGLPPVKLSINAGPRQTQQKSKQCLSVSPKKGPGIPSQVQSCTKCSFKSCDSELYWAHVVVEHPSVPSAVFYCGYTHCWFPFTSLRLKEAHEVTLHGALHRPFKCVLCKKNLVNKTALENHNSRCIKKPLYKCPCSPCDFQSKRYSQLSKHVERLHGQDLLLVDKVSYVFHHPGVEKTSDFDLSTESEEVKSEEELSEFRLVYRKENTKEDIKSDEEEEIVLSGAPQTAPAPVPAPPFQCPYESRQFPTWQHLHRHLHSSHLDTGVDMLDCPLTRDMLACICGRKTNCRDTLVVHCTRCIANTGELVEGESRKEEEEEGLQRGWLVAQRRARRKCKEMGIRGEDTPSKAEQRMLEMCRKVSARKLDMTGGKKQSAIVATDVDVVDLSDDDSCSETVNYPSSNNVNIAPAKRKSAPPSKTNKLKASRTSLRKNSEKKIVRVSSSEDQSDVDSSEVEMIVPSEVKVKCPICDKMFDREIVMEHFCDYQANGNEVLEISSGSEIDVSEEDSAVTTVSEASSEDDTPVKTNTNMLSMLANIRNYTPNVQKPQPNVVKLSTSSFSFDLTYSLPSHPITPSPLSRHGGKRTRAKLKSRGRKGYVPTKSKHGLQFKK